MGFVGNWELRVTIHLPPLKLEKHQLESVVALVSAIFVFVFFFPACPSPVTNHCTCIVDGQKSLEILVDKQHIIIILQGFKHPN